MPVAAFVGRGLGPLLASLAVCSVPVAAQVEAPAASDWPLACRLASYGTFQDTAWTHLPSLGVRHVFVSLPEREGVEALQARLKAHGLSALVCRGDGDLASAGLADRMDRQLALCAELGAKYLFLSPKHAGLPREETYDRLRAAGRIAANHGVTIVLETHPDLGTNAAVQRETMEGVGHPNVRVNFDTGNITYYNEGADVLAELEQIAPYVATVELKDHDGKPESWYFPALGKGSTDLPGVLRVLRAHGFRGPVTIEVEGIRGQEWDERQTLEAVAASVSYLRGLGGFDLGPTRPTGEGTP